MCLEHWTRCSLTIYRLIYELNHEGHDEIKSEQLDIPFSELSLQLTKFFLRPEHSREFGILGKYALVESSPPDHLCHVSLGTTNIIVREPGHHSKAGKV